MLYIKLDENKDLVITVSEPIHRGDNLNQKIIYLVPLMVDDVDMASATVYLNYIRADGCPDIVELERMSDKYNESYYQYALPISCRITKYAGEVCTWMQIYSGTPSSPVIVKSGECLLQIQESKDMDDYIGDKHITALYQLKKKMESGFEDIGTEIDTLVAEKADNIVFHEEDHTIQLIANGEPIGRRIVVSTTGGAGIIDMRITTDGELLVFFDDGNIKNLGKVVGDDGKVYVPHIDAHRVMTFTIEDEAGDIPDPVDLNPYDEWSGMDDGGETDFIWEGMEQSGGGIS